MRPFHTVLYSGTMLLGLFAVSTTPARAETDRQKTVMERVMVIGHPDRVQDITGSAQYIDEATLDTHSYSDVNRVLRQVPGVNLQEEEGFGNRPNIGLRGGRSERSADITLMEDGVLIAPAPYAAPSAYYFPRVSRMEGVEVRKGSSTIKFGPRTTNGAVNLISSSIPADEETQALLGYGTDGEQRLQLHHGKNQGNFGYVFDLGHEGSDGFKDIDIVGGNSGYSIHDFMGKIRINTNPSADIYQSLEFKFGATEEDSDETYLGLTDTDFAADPYRRYAGSQADNMDAAHRQYQLRHFVDFGTHDITTTLYRNEFRRNWYKLQSVTVGGSSESISGALESAPHLAALQGTLDLDGSATDNLTLRANNRVYYAQGIQTDIATGFETGAVGHALEVGARLHRDQEDRFQQEDDYRITNGVMALSSPGVPGSNANRESTANALALYVQDELTYGRWTLVPGLRYEHIRLEREDYGSGFSERRHSLDAIVPGLGVGYRLSDTTRLFGGVHKGFAPPSPGSTNDDEEESVNYEAGVRYSKGALQAELAGFFHDYSNLLGECTLSSGCLAATGEQYNAGEVDVQGLEASIGYDLAPALKVTSVSLPVSANYTYTTGEFNNSFVSSFDEWGNVTAGDALPYLPEHQFYLSAGVEAAKWQVHLAGKWIDEMRTQAGSGPIPAGEGTDAHFVLDVAAEAEVLDATRAFVTVDNLLDEDYVAARRPAGARPGKPFTLLAGFKYGF